MNANAPLPSLTRELAAVALEVANTELPAAALEAAVRLAQHAFGVTIAGSALTVARIARASVGDDGGPCLIFGSGGHHTAGDAAFANAVSGHASLLEDSGPGGARDGSHPGTYVFPAALAVAEQQGATGLAVILAIAAAYETVSRLGAITPAAAFARGFRAVPVLAPFGAAAAAGVLCKVSPEQLSASFGIAANLASGFNQGFLDGTMEPYLHPAFAARNGILASRLAAAGCTASANALDGERGLFAALAGSSVVAASATTRELAVCRVGTKRFATCLYNQGTLALIRDSFDAGVHAARIDRVTLLRPAAGQNGLHAPGVAAPPPYTTALGMQMSARFTAAAALLGRPVESGQYYEDAAADAEVHALAARVALVGHDAPHVIVEAALHEGRVVELSSTGESALQFSTAATREQFDARVRPVLGDGTDALLALLADLAHLDNIRSVTAHVRKWHVAARPPKENR